ncbi:MAG: tRNA preQ1(34) S-adenosylmethionine ribosyltransferase-isomerase QueA [Alphaproteobacteria bacterium]|nr:tRNA preQ1(34) S-adenosylmethionine ribosyltransferase-isomerase QueA [Alphaproteobacteria bacterium]
MRVDLFDFELPEALIALRPARPRESARLLIDEGAAFADRTVGEAPTLFRAGDLLVFNDTRVIPARLKGVRERDDGAARVEATLIERAGPARWRAFMKPGKRLKIGDMVRFGTFDARVAEKDEAGVVTLDFDLGGAHLDAAIAAHGTMPLPPYIAGRRPEDEADVADYQTVYARRDGAVAAPTAGLHFTEDLLRALDGAGLGRAFVTLHVGAGTFLPVKADDTAHHVMHSEWREISEETAARINQARRAGRRIVAIGTTALRTLESAADESGEVRATTGATDIFITPGYRFRIVDGLWTNFHLPRSTLFMLIAAFIGLERAHAAYAQAISQRYRFYSYGDACLFWRSAA